MSSELIGELGQVGLTIPRKRPPSTRIHDDTNGDNRTTATRASVNAKDPLAVATAEPTQDDDDSAVTLVSPEVKRRRNAGGSGAGAGTSRAKKFRSDWLRYDIFKHWLQPHADPELAICSVCNRVIKAGKSELEKHASGKKHIDMMKNKKTTSEGNHATPEERAKADGADKTLSQPVENNLPVSSQRPDEHSGMASTSDGNYATGVLALLDPIQRIQPILPEEATVTSITKATVLKMAPHWKTTAVVNGHVTRLDLNDYKGRYLVLVFYPQDFAKLCANEVNRLSDRVDEFRAINAEVVACSTDSHLSHLAWLKRPRTDNGVFSVRIALLADPTQTICKDYGVYLPDKGHALRAHFIIDDRGILRHASINDPLIGRGTDEILRIIQALQYSDEVQDTMPVDWEPHH